MRHAYWSQFISMSSFFLFCLTAGGGELSTVRWGGSARTRFEYDYFTNFQNVRQMTWMRFRPYLAFEPEGGINLYFEPQFAKAMGENVVSSNSTTGSAEQNSGVTSDPSLGIHQAFMNYSPSSAFQLRIGRQVLSYGDELVIGALEWNNVARAFDGIRLRNESELKVHDLFWSKLVDSNVTGGGSGDYDFLGSYNSFRKLAGINEIDLYALYLQDTRGNGSAILRLWTAGLRLKSKTDRLDYRMEVTQQLGQISGQASQTHGTQADLEIGYSLPGDRPFRVGLEGFYSDPEYNQLFPTVHKWLGTLDAFGRRNIKGFKIHTTTHMNDRLKIMIDGHRYYRTDQSSPAYRINGSAISGTTTEDPYLATELDITSQYDISDRTSIQVGAAALFVGTTLKNVQSRNPLFGYTSWEVKF